MQRPRGFRSVRQAVEFVLVFRRLRISLAQAGERSAEPGNREVQQSRGLRSVEQAVEFALVFRRQRISLAQAGNGIQ